MRIVKTGLSTILAVALMVASAIGQQFRDAPRVYIEPVETVDASNARDKANHVDFGTALAAAIVKKKTPVVIVTDKDKAQWVIQSAASQREDSTGTKIAKIMVDSRWSRKFTKFEGTIQVVDIESSAVLYAYNVKKDNFQSAAEAFAKHFKDDYLKKMR